MQSATLLPIPLIFKSSFFASSVVDSVIFFKLTSLNKIFKIASIGILTAVVNQILKYAGKDEIATLTPLAGVIVV